MNDLRGQTIRGYELREQIGVGAFGAIYRARQPVVDREVAIKIILPEHANHPDFIRRFEVEAQLVAQLEHLHIVPLYDYWRDPQGAYLVMRLMKGGTLEQTLRRGPLSLSQVSRWLEQIGSALAAAHRQGVIHRDLKPANILLDEEGNAYLSDFGIAKVVRVQAQATATGVIVGTPAYISPEQLQSQALTPQADIYSLGVMLFEMLTGQHPFKGSSSGELLVKHLTTPLPHLQEVRPDLSAELDRVIQCATAKDPAARYADVMAFVADFRRALAPEAVPAPARPAAEQPLTSVPTPLTSFVGRQREMAEIKQLLSSYPQPPSPSPDELLQERGKGARGMGARLLTLTGAGGCGKTRLAIQVATDLANANRYKHGVWWAELAALSDPALVPQKVAEVFDLRESADAPLITVLTNYFRAKELLLVLDNCEHLIEACAQLAEALLSACPRLQILATSREALSITGEVAWYVPSLESPDPQNMPPLESLPQYDAIRLLVERAQAVVPHWQLADHATAAAHICCRLDGIPLAIELAAARLKVLSAEQIVERLNDRFQLLTGGSRTALPRHRTLRAMIDWSYNLLSEEEQALFRRLAVFAGGWTLEAAEKVCSGQWMVGSVLSTALDVLSALVDKSLVVVEQSGNATRYRLLETVRQHAREKLREAKELQVYSRRHLDWFLQLAEQTDPKLRRREQMEWCEKLELDIENLRAALAWSLTQTDAESAEMTMRLAGALWWFWLMRGYWDEARTWLERSLQNRSITPARARSLVGLAMMEYYAGTAAKSQALLDEALTLYRQQGDKWGIAFTASLTGSGESDPSRARALFKKAREIAQELNDEWLAARIDIGQGMYAARRGDLSLACSHYESALDHARRAGDRWLIANALGFWGGVALDQGDDDRAAALFAESLEVRRGLGNKNGMAISLYGLGKIALHRHEGQQASEFFNQALTLRREMGNTREVVKCLWALGRAAPTEQRYERAAWLLGSIQALCGVLNDKDRRAYEDDVRAVRAQLDETTFNTAWAEGQAMTLEQAIEYALENVNP